MGRKANFVVVAQGPAGDLSAPLTIRDMGPWTEHASITNDAEGVIARLLADGRLQPGQRLMYYDSDGDLSELLVEGGRFAGFKAVG